MGQLADAYTSFFHHYDKSTLVIVNAAAIDLVNNDDEYEALVQFIISIKQGRHYYNPVPGLL
jgi:deoxyadenosine/deoxycytidine kinase